MSWISDVFGGTFGTVISSVGETIDRFVTTDEDKVRAELAKAEIELKFKRAEMEAEMKYFADRQSAREMYMKDSGLQKTFAVVFLIGYLLVTGFMIWMVLKWAGGVDLPDWGVMLISAVFTAMSTKVNTIVDFLFGGSKGQDDSEKRVAQAFQGGDQPRKGQVFGPPPSGK